MLEDDGYSRDISTHAPLAGRDFLWYIISMKPFGFQPTRPCGARRMTCLLMQSRMKCQPTRPLRGATVYGRRRFLIYHISTHAPLAGRDKYLWYLSRTEQEFQPTRPLRGATNRVLNPCNSSNISTHAPLAGRDECSTPISSIRMRISTHAPLAGRDRSEAYSNHQGSPISTHAPLAGRDGSPKWYTIPKSVFQPTRPLRGATPIGNEIRV